MSDDQHGHDQHGDGLTGGHDPADPSDRGATTPPDDVARILADLDLPTKVALLSGADAWHLEPVPSVGFGRTMVADGPHGLRKIPDDGEQVSVRRAVPATCFPTAVTLASSWDEALLEEVGRALGREALAEDISVVLGPGVNLKRHPAGGRNFEYLSEDPLLAGRLAVAMVRGIQSQGPGACVKHLAANHQETFRMVIDTVVDERTLRELELTGFELAIRGGRPWTVMSAYNQLNGVPATDNRWLLTEVLRDEWGFDGLVMSDWGGMHDRVAATAAGNDLEMPGSNGAFDAEVIAAVRDGDLDEEHVDRCARRVIELIVRAAANRVPTATVDQDAHHALARRAAAAGSVLLTNDGTLPLSADADLAVIGAFATTPRYQGAGSSQVNPTRLDDPIAAIRERIQPGVEVTFAPAYDPTTGTTTDALIEQAVEAAQTAGRAVIIAGLPGRYESEGFDRADLELPAGHLRVIDAVLDAGVPTVVVLQNGAPVELPFADRVPAILESYLGGQAGGAALADVLFGDVEPGGRLAESFPVAMRDLAADANFPGHPRQVEHREGLLVGYRFHDTAGVPARFAFGHGLSYTTFEYGQVEVTGDGTDRTATVTVTNVGGRPGTEVVQLYVRAADSAVWRPDKELKAFAKVQLEPGSSQQIQLDLDRRSFAIYDVSAGDWLVEAGTYELLVGTSSVDIRTTASIEVASDDDVTPVPAPAGTVATDEEFARLLGTEIPTPRPAQPFHRNSSVADLTLTPMGRKVHQAIMAAARYQVQRTVPEDDEATHRMFESVFAEAPLRTLPLHGGGKPPMIVIDRTIDALNGRPKAALADLLERLRS